jgi:hypothetical protein
MWHIMVRKRNGDYPYFKTVRVSASEVEEIER